MDAILNTVPIFRWLPKYHWRRDLGSDIVAGLTVAIMHIPQGTTKPKRLTIMYVL